jgi:Electron transfer DM13
MGAMPRMERARRHPGRTVGLLAVVVVVAASVAFYLISPLFIRTTLVEAAPSGFAAASGSPIATDPVSSTAPSLHPSVGPSATATAAPTPTGPRIVAAGEFHGTDEVHYGSGTATIIETEPGKHTLRFEDFSVLNGPDLFVYLSPDATGYSDAALELGRLKATDGSFNYELPAGTDPADFASAIIWCKQFSHLFAVAPFAAD